MTAPAPLNHPDEIDIDDYLASLSPEQQAAIKAQKGWAKREVQRMKDTAPASPIELPQLPPMVDTYEMGCYPEGYTAEQMNAYGQLCYEAGVRARARMSQDDLDSLGSIVNHLNNENCCLDGTGNQIWDDEITVLGRLYFNCTNETPYWVPERLAAAIRKGE